MCKKERKNEMIIKREIKNVLPPYLRLQDRR